jgi:iron(III) transport system ATP-binding protein
VARDAGISAYLRIENLTKTFGDFRALDDVELEIDEGEFICFLGPSGCGKTTLLRAIAGLDIQTSGRVLQAGRDISALPPSERDFGIVFQSYALFPNITVAKNIAYGLENRRQPRHEIQRRVDELLTTVGLADQANKYPAQLSGGQQQRVALARALATSPGLLLLDEPLSALDAKVRLHLRAELKALQRKLGVTTIMVTHDQEEALSVADRIVVMNRGVIEQVGSSEEIYRRPATAFVADFIGVMNFIPGAVASPDRVRMGPVEMSCSTEGRRPGEAITLAIRPEDILVGNGRGSVNAVDSRIREIDYLGSFYRAELVGPAFGAGTVRADLELDVVRSYALRAGVDLPVRLPPEHLRLYSRT